MNRFSVVCGVVCLLLNIVRADPISKVQIGYVYQPIITTSPKKTFTITQLREEEGFTSKVTFMGSGHAAILEPSPIPWSGDYRISPDEKWICRIQKTGSGDNNVFLYEVRNLQVFSVKPGVGEAAWEFHERMSPYKNVPLYHTGFEFIAWDTDGNLVLTMHGTSDDHIESHHVGGFAVKYNLKTKTFTKG